MSQAAAALLLIAFFGNPLAAATPPTPVATSRAEPPAEVRELLDLLSRPAVRDWLKERGAQPPAAPTVAPEEQTFEAFLAARTSAIRQHLRGLLIALPLLPDEIGAAGERLFATLSEQGMVRALVLLGAIIAAGYAVEQLLYRLTRSRTQGLAAASAKTSATIRDRLGATTTHLTLRFAPVGGFALGSVGMFLAIGWPAPLGEVVLGFLVAVIVFRLAHAFSAFVLSPDDPNLRLVVLSSAAARFWHLRWGLLAGWFSFGWATAESLSVLGGSLDSRRLVAQIFGIGLLAIGIEIAWRRPRAAPIGASETLRRSRSIGDPGAWLRTVYFVALWLLWVAGALPLFWLAVFVAAVPASLRLTQAAVDHILRGDGTHAEAGASLLTVFIERGVRAALIVGAALLLARAWQMNLPDMATQETTFTRLLAGALSAVVVLLLADLAWQLVRTAIDQKLARASLPAPAGSEEAHRQMRMRTLLPILRTVALVLIVTLALMMVLAHLGVQIGPLIASAGIIGIAVGFGAQTLVRDVISGVLYLLDDAFRVGEYIESGTFKGTVEAIGFRSVKLRHHRGPIFTVPFGVLGAVKNTSRDWVIDKILVGVTYDTDLAKVKTLVKQVGKELQRDPELAPHIIEPLKMQGVSQFGDFAIQIQMKMMTRPNEQFTIRRRANVLIKRAFDTNGIKFAFPTVQVAGSVEEPAAAAAARTALALVPGQRSEQA